MLKILNYIGYFNRYMYRLQAVNGIFLDLESGREKNVTREKCEKNIGQKLS